MLPDTPYNNKDSLRRYVYFIIDTIYLSSYMGFFHDKLLVQTKQAVNKRFGLTAIRLSVIIPIDSYGER